MTHPEIHSGVAGEEASLGKKNTERRRALDTFAAPLATQATTYRTEEVTALCPITGQPDWYNVEITVPGQSKLLIESKSLKLYLQSFREEGLFCEAFAQRIATDVGDAVGRDDVLVTVAQKPRGGVSIVSTSGPERRGNEDGDR